MADTVFSPVPPLVPSISEVRDVFAEDPRDTGLRVEASKEGDVTASPDQDRSTSSEERRAEIERLAEAALSNSRLSIKRDDQSGDFIYIMIDDYTGETVRRWPPESHSDLVDYLRTQTAGLVDRTA